MRRSWWLELLNPRRKPRQSDAQPKRALLIEQLEDRTLPSTLAVNATTKLITFTATSNDSALTIAFDPTGNAGKPKFTLLNPTDQVTFASSNDPNVIVSLAPGVATLSATNPASFQGYTLVVNMGTFSGTSTTVGLAGGPASGLSNDLRFQNTGGPTSLIIDDSSGAGGATIGIGSTSAAFTGGPTFDYSGALLGQTSVSNYGLTLMAADAGGNAVTVTGAPSLVAFPGLIDTGAGTGNSVTFGDALNPASGIGDFDVQTDTGGSTDLTIDDSAAATGQVYFISDNSGHPSVTIGVVSNFGFASATLSTPLTVLGGSGGDVFNVDLVSGPEIDINGNAGADSLVFGDGASLFGGSFDGGSEVDGVDYSAFTTAVAVNLGLGVTGLSATLGSDQAVPVTASTATGTAAFSNYSALNKTFDVTITVSGIAPAGVTALTLNRAPVGVNGTSALDLLTGNTLTPAGDGFTLTLTGVQLDALDEAAFLGGITYLSVSTAAGVQIRGQVFSNGNVDTTAVGTATGTGAIMNVENAAGGGGNDSLVGSFADNILTGNGGNDVMLGAPGADTFDGGTGDDVMVWSNGDGSDVMDGGAGSDLVQVNGNVTNADSFTVAAGTGTSAGRVDFDRVTPAPFGLDIGTTETLNVNGIGGDDSFTVGDLTGVTDLTLVRLGGFAGNDTFNVTPSATVALDVTGGDPAPPALPGDTLTVDLTGTTAPGLTATSTATGLTGAFTFGDRQSVNFSEIEALTPSPAPAFTSAPAATFQQGAAGTFTVSAFGATMVTLAAGAGLPPGVTLTDNGNGTATLAGAPTASGAFTFTVTAANAFGTTTQSFTLTVNQAPVITSGNSATFTVGVAGAFTVTAVGFPAPTLSVSAGALPPGVTLSPAGILSGTPTTAGTFAFTIRAANAVGTADLAVSLSVRAAPVQLSGVGPHVLAYNADGSLRFDLIPFSGFDGGVAVATADVNGDGTPDVIAGTAIGSSHVKVFDGNSGTELFSFLSFDGFLGGISVSSGDINNDGFADIVVGTASAASHVKVFDGRTGGLIQSFLAFPTSLGVSVGAGDINHDGFADVIVGAAAGSSLVKVFDGRGAGQILGFQAFAGYAGGVSVAGGDLDGDGRAEVLVGANGNSHVKAFDADGSERLSFLAYPGFGGAVRVGSVDTDGDGRFEILTGAGPGASPHVKRFDGRTLSLLDSFLAFDPSFTGGIFVG